MGPEELTLEMLSSWVTMHVITTSICTLERSINVCRASCATLFRWISLRGSPVMIGSCVIVSPKLIAGIPEHHQVPQGARSTYA